MRSVLFCLVLTSALPTRAADAQGYPFSQRGSVTQNVALTEITVTYEANRIHAESAAVKKFAGILYPNCLAPVEFTEYRQIDTAAKAELIGAKRADVF